MARRPRSSRPCASVAIAEAAAHAAEARRDLARAVSRLARDPVAEQEPEPLKAAMARLRRARVDRARSERDAARLEVGRAEAEAERDRATVAFRTKQVERVKQLAARKAVEGRLVDEHELRRAESRHFQHEAEAGVKSARARLAAAEARLKAVEGEAGGDDRGPGAPPADALALIGSVRPTDGGNWTRVAGNPQNG